MWAPAMTTLPSLPPPVSAMRATSALSPGFPGTPLLVQAQWDYAAEQGAFVRAFQTEIQQTTAAMRQNMYRQLYRERLDEIQLAPNPPWDTPAPLPTYTQAARWIEVPYYRRDGRLVTRRTDTVTGDVTWWEQDQRGWPMQIEEPDAPLGA